MSNRGLVSKTHKELLKLNTCLYTGRRCEQSPHRRRQADDEMLSITCELQVQQRETAHLLPWLKSQTKHTRTPALAGLWSPGTRILRPWDCEMVRPLRRAVGQFFTKLEILVLCVSVMALLGVSRGAGKGCPHNRTHGGVQSGSKGPRGTQPRGPSKADGYTAVVRPDAGMLCGDKKK